MCRYLRAAVSVIGLICAVTAQFDPDVPITGNPDVKGCIDLIIAIDTSCSITEENQESARNLTSGIIRALEQTATFGSGFNDIRVGVIRFQEEIKTVLSLEEGANPDTIINTIERVIRDEKEPCHTRTFAALEEIQFEFTKLRPESQGVSQVLFLVYDGITYSSSGFKEKPKTMVQIAATKAAGAEVYVFQQHYKQQTGGQDPDIELNALEHDDQHRFLTTDTNVRDVLLVMADQEYTRCGSDEPFCEPLPTTCTALSVQSFIDPSKSWSHETRVDTWTKDNTFRFSKINLGLSLDSSVDTSGVPAGSFLVSFESQEKPNHFLHVKNGKLSLSRRDPKDALSFDQEASFIEHVNHWPSVTPKHTALESFVERGSFIRETSAGELESAKDDGSDAFKKSASFLYTILK